jgi:hypothetical protein
MIRAIKRGETRMTLPADIDFSTRELSVDELDAIAAGSIWSWIKSELTAIANSVHVIYASKDHPPLPGGPYHPGGPYRV